MAKYYCFECGAEVSGKGRRCKSCAQKACWTKERKENYSKRVKKAWKQGVYGDESYLKKISQAKKKDWDEGVYDDRNQGRPPVMVKCQLCGEKFEVLVSELERGGGKYCSLECYKKDDPVIGRTGKDNHMFGRTGKENPNWRGGISMVKKVCEVCGKTFEATAYAPGRFCSIECHGKWISKNKSGKNSPLWRGGQGSYRGPGWSRQAEKARNRDDYTCQECGLSQKDNGKKLDVHHVVPFRLFDNYREANKLSNLITLCPSCHHKIERA